MRIFTYSTLIVLSAMLLVAAQGVGQPPAKENLDTVLRGWEKAMTELQSFACVVQRQTLDKSVGARDEFKGYAMFMKPLSKDDGSRARLELTKVSNSKIFEKYICTGTYLYEYAPATQTIRVHNMPQNKAGGAQQESFLSFLFGMGAEQAKARYDMTLVYPQDGKPDPNYHYLQIIPRTAQDKADFSFARLSLFRANHLPAQIWYLQPNKSEITWNFSEVQTNVQIPTKYFTPDEIPGWKMERVRPQGPPAGPTTIRPAGK
jgi:TIGR03009 family protein